MHQWHLASLMDFIYDWYLGELPVIMKIPTLNVGPKTPKLQFSLKKLKQF
jgi:hypothetical protein